MTRAEKLLAKLEAMKQQEAEFNARCEEAFAEFERIKERSARLEKRIAESERLLKEWGDALNGNEY